MSTVAPLLTTTPFMRRSSYHERILSTPNVKITEPFYCFEDHICFNLELNFFFYLVAEFMT